MLDYQNLSDHELADLLKKSDHIAFSALYDRYKGVLYAHIKRMLSNQEESKDIIQEVYTTLWLKRGEINFNTSVKAYLYKAVQNRVLTTIAHRKFEINYLNSLDQIFAQSSCNSAEEILFKELSALIETEIQNLPQKMREVFEMSRKQHLSHKEIADKLNISDKTVKKQINNAINILRPKINLILAVLPFL